ncbi:MAG: T9SS type A sorting domain-containing protein, partial [Candidatus Cloacimonetes bacterium]|nr:T9SS type A sorting domain-containing protein [Candidatus Cloacimonadota bacterium]
RFLWLRTRNNQRSCGGEGQTLTIDLDLLEALRPPQNITTNIMNEGASVIIQWQSPDFTRELQGYSVWRFEESLLNEPDNWTLVTELLNTYYIDTEWSDLASGIYYYAVTANYITDNSVAVISDPLDNGTPVDDADSPTIATALLENCPNPFNPDTEIRFSLAESSKVSLSIYNAAGQKITTLVEKVLPSGMYSVNWNGVSETGKPVASGVYFTRLKTNSSTYIQKMLLLK